jgi:aminoglycoside phosphotransferase (APT) family kinase protein
LGFRRWKIFIPRLKKGARATSGTDDDFIRQLLDRLNGEVGGWQPGAALVDLDPLIGGQSSLTYRATLSGASVAGRPIDDMVLKVAVPGVAPVRNRDVLRQARLIRALAVTSPVPVPTVFFESEGDPPDIPPLFAMSLARGETLEPNTEDEGVALPGPDIVRHRALGAAKVLAQLHAVTLSADLQDDASPVDIRDEISKWRKALSTVDPNLTPGYERAGDRLLGTAPADRTPTLVHGDYRLGNILFDGPDMTAVIDWEIWGRADPRIDLGWFLMTAEPDVHPAAVRDCPGMPSPTELLDAYTAESGVDLESMDWFRAFTLYKYAAIVGLIVKHRRKGGGPDDEFTARVAPRIPSMVAACEDNLA